MSGESAKNGPRRTTDIGLERVQPAHTSPGRTRFLQRCVNADMPEATRPAATATATIQKWWPQIKGSFSSEERAPGPGLHPPSKRDQTRRLRVRLPGQPPKAHHVAKPSPLRQHVCLWAGHLPQPDVRAGDGSPVFSAGLPDRHRVTGRKFVLHRRTPVAAVAPAGLGPRSLPCT